MTSDPKPSQRPNVIFVLTDDQGYGDLSCHGNPVLRTPALDRLHAESARFSRFHVCPVCTPTRGELMTGCDAMRNGATFVCMGRTLLRSDLPTMANLFADTEYHTGHFGKWHLGDNYPYRPQDRGFHETIHHPGFGVTSAPDYFGNDYFDDHYRHRDEIQQYKGYCTDVWFNEAMAWMRGCAKRNEPFFTHLATNAPHGPLWVPDHFRDPYRGRVKAHEASFFAMIASIDQNMARLEEFLSRSGLRENTILIFMTDNGTAVGHEVFNAGMRGRKAFLYDGGHRVPCFVRWPAGGIGGGRDTDGVARSTDLLPTLVDLCGLKAPDGWRCDGLSWARHLREPSCAAPDRMACIQYGHPVDGVWGATKKGHAAVLWNDWRLVENNELFDIRSDPGQQRDIAAAHPDVVARMRDHYEKWWARNGQTLGAYQSLTIGADAENPIKLSSADWAWAYGDNQQNIRGCAMESGTWHVNVARRGRYSLTLRRWPEESGLGIAAAAPIMQGVDGTWPEGKALPVASAWIRAGAVQAAASVPPGATHVTFTMGLSAGPAQIRTWWIDAEGQYLAGAYYLTAERLD